MPSIETLERDLETTNRRSEEAHRLADEADAHRDRVLRDAHAAGITTPRIAELTGLKAKQINQVHRATGYPVPFTTPLTPASAPESNSQD
jgi:hypothetical protein